LGCRASGKTSFISGLSLLTRPQSDSRFQAVTKDAPTAKAFANLRRLADNRQWPPATSTLTPLALEISYKQTFYDLEMLDYPGEDLLAAMESMEPDEYQVILEGILKTDCLLVLVDPTQDLNTPLTMDRDQVKKRQDAIAQAISHLTHERTKADLPLPVVLLLITKKDKLQREEVTLEDVVADNRLLLENLKAYARVDVEFIAISACGTCSDDEYPSEPHPEGYDQVFERIENLFLKRRIEKPLIYGFVIVLMLLVLGFSWYSYQESSENDKMRRIIDEFTSSHIDPEDSDAEIEAKENTHKKKLDLLTIKFKSCVTQSDYKTCLKDAQELLAEAKGSRHLSEIRALHGQMKVKADSALYELIQDANAQGHRELAIDLIYDYKTKFPAGSRIEDVRSLLREILSARQNEMLSQIRAIKIMDQATLTKKVIRIRNYLKANPQVANLKEIERALVFADRLAGVHEVQIYIRECGFDGEPRTVRVWSIINGTPKEVFDSEVEGLDDANKYDIGERVVIASPNFQKWDLKLENLDGKNKVMGKQAYPILQSINEFDGREIRITKNPADDKMKHLTKWFRLNLCLKKQNGWTCVGDAYIKAYGKYIHPGDAW